MSLFFTGPSLKTRVMYYLVQEPEEKDITYVLYLFWPELEKRQGTTIQRLSLHASNEGRPGAQWSLRIEGVSYLGCNWKPGTGNVLARLYRALDKVFTLPVIAGVRLVAHFAHYTLSARASGYLVVHRPKAHHSQYRLRNQHGALHRGRT